MSFNSIGNAVTDSVALATLVVPATIEPGTKVLNEAVGAYFTYTISTASLVTDQVVAVNGVTGARWIIDIARTVQAVTTSGATPSVAMPFTAKSLTITLGADVTSLTVTGLDSSADGKYTGDAVVVGGGALVKLRPNNISSNVFCRRFEMPGSALVTNDPDFVFSILAQVDASAPVIVDFKLYCPPAAPRMYMSRSLTEQGGTSYKEDTVAYSTGANASDVVTSLVWSGAMKAGTVITLYRG